MGKLRDVKRATVADLAEALQSREVDDARRAVEELVESGLVQAHGTGKGRSYTMSAQLYRQLGQKSQHIRQTGFEAKQQRQMVLKYVKEHGSIKRAEAAELCGICAGGRRPRRRLLRRLFDRAVLGRTAADGGSAFSGGAGWAPTLRRGLPVQAHIARPDPFDGEPVFVEWVESNPGVALELHRYDGVGHYFLDHSLPDFEGDAADLCLERCWRFLRGL